MNIHDWLLSLRFGERYYKPANITWDDLEYEIESRHSRYRRQFAKYRLHRLGDILRLECRCCGAIESPRRD